MTKISWANETWNPVAGCTPVSAGCKNCYAIKMAARLEAMGQAKYKGLTRKVNRHSVWTGEINVDSDLRKPYNWKNPRMIFVNSMSDLFHKNVPPHVVHAVFQAADDNPQHTFQVLTKRPDIMARYVNGYGFDVPQNMWIGVSVEDDKTAYERIEYLGVLPAGNIGFVSYEPALGPVDWSKHTWTGIKPNSFFNWLIVGAESGPNRRPFDMQWARDARDACIENDIAFFFKQQSANKPGQCPYIVNEDGSRWEWHQFPGDLAEPVQVMG